MNLAVYKTALTNLETALLAATVSPKPSYSIDGQSVSWAEYLKMLMDGIEYMNKLIGQADPVEIRTSMQ